MKVFKYIFKQKLLITFTIILLLLESLCTFATPFISSFVIDYGVESNGIIYAVPLRLDPYAYRSTIRVIDSPEDKSLFQNSYNIIYSDTPIYENDNEQTFYEINFYGLFHIGELERISIPLFGFTASYSGYVETIDNKMGVPDIKDVPPGLINEIKAEIEDYKKSHTYEEMFDSAIEQKIIENSFMGINSDDYKKLFINAVAIFMIFVVFVYLLVTIIGTYLASRISFTISRELRKKQFKKVMSFSNHDMDKFSRASLITRATNDLQIVQNTSVFVIRNMLIAPVMLVIGFTMSIFTAPSLVWIVAAAIVFVLIMAVILISIVMPKYKLIQKLVDKINSVARESISGVSIVRALNNEQFQEDRFTETNKSLYKTMVFAMSILILAMPLLMLVVNAVSITILWAGSFQLQAGSLDIGQLIAFITYSTETIFAFLSIAAGFVMLPRADVSIGRIEEVLKHELKIDNFAKTNKVHEESSNDDEYISLKNVSFNYDGNKKKLFNNLNVVIKKNSINAIVGPTGSGKSTLLKLLLRYYDVSSGEVCIGGVNVKDFCEQELRDKISYVPQKVILFQGSLAKNVGLNPAVTDRKHIEKCLRFTNLGPFMDSQKEGIDYEVHQGALNLSGGQKQRLSIARAISEGLPILLLDDPFSALDANTEKMINEGLQKQFKDTTILVVTQRLSSVVDYDNIIFIDNGKVCGTGTHEQLMKNSKKYRTAFEKAKSPTIEEVI